ncbi:MAG: MFS transporter [Chitinivibrionales bacterium]|nr:MFS transporter [Chitinivibrionales bacterium]MBD3394225.1 MFS transporter [Chitinivibrionales bacterium]
MPAPGPPPAAGLSPGRRYLPSSALRDVYFHSPVPSGPQNSHRGEPLFLQSSRFKLLVLTAVHFSVDFFAGLAAPLPEPTLTTHLGVTLTLAALLVGGSGFVINLVQPLAGWLLPKRGMPALLLLGPVCAACMTLVGLSHSFAVAAVLFLISGIGIGIIHPEAALVASGISRRLEGLGMGVFMSGGYLGFASGSFVSGLWAEHFNQDISMFWILAFPVAVVLVLVVLAGLHRVSPHAADRQSDTRGMLPFALPFALGVAVAVLNLILFRTVTIHLVRSFPGQPAQAWGGATVSALGLCGAIGAFFWGYLSERLGFARMSLLLIACGSPFYFLLVNVRAPSAAPLLGAAVGLTLSAVFPLTVVLVRRSHGLSARLRMGLIIGGSWGCGEVLFIFAGRYIDSFETGASDPVRTVLNISWALIVIAAILAMVIDRFERGVVPTAQDAAGSTENDAT